jgi:hypothetical protein
MIDIVLIDADGDLVSIPKGSGFSIQAKGGGWGPPLVVLKYTDMIGDEITIYMSKHETEDEAILARDTLIGRVIYAMTHSHIGFVILGGH